MSAAREELILPVEWEYIDACNGFSFDMGGSVMKIVFVDKKDWVEPSQRKPGSKGNLHMVNFARSELDQAVDFILDRVRIPKMADGSMPKIYSTGLGGSQYSKLIREKIGVQNSQLTEFDCFNVSFMYLMKNLPRKEILHPVYRKPFEEAIEARKKIVAMFESMKGMSDVMDNMMESFEQMKLENKEIEQLKELNPDKPFIADNDLFPCGIMMCGSGFGLSIIQADGTSRFIRGSPRGGKMLLGLASLLAETDNFEDLLKLSEKGNPFSVSTSNHAALEGTKQTNDKDMYGKWGEMSKEIPEELSFCYGNAHGKRIGDFSKEDLASCIVDTHVNDMVNLVFPAVAAHGLKHLFFCGGFVNHRVVREVITRYWVRISGQMQMMDSTLKRGEIQFHFLIHSQSLGALGALLNHKMKWSEKNKMGNATSEGEEGTGKTETGNEAIKT